MKRFISILLAATLLSCSLLFAEEEQGDIYDDNYIYQINGAGDQLLKIEIGGFFPMNFGNKLYPGAEFTFGYYNFLTEMISLGGEFSICSDFSIGGKPMFVIPVTLGINLQPTIGKFEFPIYAGAGIASVGWANLTNFPSFTAKASLGAYYRVSESWSFGLSGSFFWIPQINADTSKSRNGFFANAGLNVRYHF